MKISIKKLKQIIKEEIEKALKEDDDLKIDQDRKKRNDAERDGWLDFRDDGDRGDRWEYDEPEYLESYLLGYNNAAAQADREYSEQELDQELMDEKWNKQQKGKKRAAKVAKRKSKKKKCKGSGCATPDEVKKYAAAIQRDADNKGEIEYYYGAATAAARQPGSLGGTAVVEKKGYKK